jgi:hypothetical protein
MRITCLLAIMLGILFALSSCQSLNEAKLKGTDPVLSNLEALTFTANSVSGQVQIKENRTAPWRDLKQGETFNGFAMIRTGFRSGAKLSMKNGYGSTECELGDLLCCTSVRDIYINVLSPASRAKYQEKLWENGEKLNPDAAIMITRASLKGAGESEKFSLLAEASDLLYQRNQQRVVTGAAGAAGGGAPGGGGSGGGGCPGGG